jgi:phage/plasmid-like protein (TIGR03299 family)
MAANIAYNFQTGGKSFYSLKQPAWHTQGTVVDLPLSHPEVLRVGGLAWEVDRKDLLTTDLAIVPDSVAMVRRDTGAILSVVSRDYTQVQNHELMEWLVQVQGIDTLTIETAGALGDGGQVWLMARIPGLDCVIGKDASLPYLLITNGHTGRHTLRIVPTAIRVVCANTLRMATAGGPGNTLSSGWEIRHRSGIRQAMGDIAHAYDSAVRDWEMTCNAIQALADEPSTAESLQAIAAAAFPLVAVGGDETERAKALRDERAARLLQIRASETCNVAGTEGTIYSDLQAVTEMLDHEGGRSDASRFESAMFGGDRDRQKARAWDAALALV